METLSFDKKQRTKIKVNIYGDEYELRKPKVGEAEMFDAAEVESMTPREKFDRTKKMMADFGLPIEVANEMELEHYNELVGIVL